MPIHRLSVQLANQIAAGEVVERPASVVKELVENAIDAGAGHITLELTGAGRQSIVVRDNGSGIPRDELMLALEPHCTSKIYTLEDLEAIQTMGFRGEALASIAAVSKLTLTSKPKDQDKAYKVHTEGPEMTPIVEPAAHPDGTSVEVRELFFNTPARRRFLRSDKTELNRIKDIMLRIAMAHSAVSFEVTHEGRRLLTAPAAPKGDENAAIKRLGRLIGTDFVNDALPLNVKNGSLEIKGLLLPPGPLFDSTPESIYLYLNERPVADKLLIHALREAYSEIRGGKSPVRAVLFLKCDPHEVDVNVHPRKDEVRFHAARLVHDILVDAVVNGFSASGLPPANAPQGLNPAPESTAANPALNDFNNPAPQGQPLPAQPVPNPAAVSGFDQSAVSDFNQPSPSAGPIIPPSAGASRLYGQNGSSGTAGRRQAARSAVQGIWQHEVFKGGVPIPPPGPAPEAPSPELINQAAESFAQQADIAGLGQALGAGQSDDSQVSISETTVVNFPEPEDEEPPVSNTPAGRMPQPETVVKQSVLTADAERVGAYAAQYQREIAEGVTTLKGTVQQVLAEALPEIRLPDVLRAVLLDRPQPEVLLLKIEGRYFLVRASALLQHLYVLDLCKRVREGKLESYSLTLPFTLRCEAAMVRALKTCPEAAERLGFTFKLKRESIEFNTLPLQLKGAELASVLGRVLHLLAAGAKSIEKGELPKQLAAALCAHYVKPRTFGMDEAQALCAKIGTAAELAALDGASELLIGQWAAQLCGLSTLQQTQ